MPDLRRFREQGALRELACFVLSHRFVRYPTRQNADTPDPRAEAETTPPPSEERGVRFPLKSEVTLRAYKTPFEPFLVTKLRFWPPHHIPRLLVPRKDLRGRGCSLEERLVAIYVDGVSTLAELSELTGLELSVLALHVGAMCERKVLQVD